MARTYNLDKSYIQKKFYAIDFICVKEKKDKIYFVKMIQKIKKNLRKN